MQLDLIGFPSPGPLTADNEKITKLQGIVLPNGLSWSFSYDAYDRLTQITLPTGGTIAYGWTIFGSCRNGTAFIPPAQYYSAGATERVVNANDGTGPHTWTYTGAFSTAPGVTITRTITGPAPAGNQSVHILTPPASNSCAVFDSEAQEYQGSASGSPLRTTTTSYSYNFDPSYTSPLNLVPTSITTAWANGATKKVSKTYDSGFTFSLGSLGNYTGIYGKVMSESDYDYGSGGAGPLLRRTVYNYQAFVNSNYLIYNLFDFPYSTTVYDSTSNTCKGVSGYCAYSYFGYDEVGLQTSGVGTQRDSSPPNGNYRGNRTSINSWLNGSTVSHGPCTVSVSNGYLISKSVFYDTGEIQKQSDPCLYPTSFLYSSTYAGALPTTITNALGQQTVNIFDFNTSLLLTKTDPNQKQTSYTYDLSSRLTQVVYPDGGLTSYSYTDAIPVGVTLTKAITSGFNLVKTAVLDGLARVSQTQLVDPDCNSTSGLVFVNRGYGYSTTGANSTVSNPYCQTSDTTYGITTTNEDALGRVANVVESDGSQVLTTYTGNCTTVTDEAGKARKACIDGLDRMTGAWEDPAGLGYETDYQYDALGDLTNVNQKGSNGSARVRTFTYDSLSRLLCAANPEIQPVTCPSSGTFPAGAITYAYDANGNVSSRTSPLPNQSSAGTTVTTNYMYDALNRLTTKSYMDGTTQDPYTPTIQFGYDGVALTGCTKSPPTLPDSYPIGRRTSMCDGSGATSWDHDPMGRIEQDKRFIGGISTALFVNYGYNLAGDIAYMTTPPLKTLAYYYDGSGRPNQLLDLTDTITFATGATYAPPGQLTGMTVGGISTFAGYTVSNVYSTRLQPILLSASVGSTSVFSECFDFHLKVPVNAPCSFSANSVGDNGNVYQIVNNRDGNRTQNFLYDPLNRIWQAYTNGTNWGETFAPTPQAAGTAFSSANAGIDAWGNLANWTPVTGKTNPGSGWNCAGGTNNQLNTCYNYDAAGNLMKNGTVAYTYDAENRLIATAGTSYVYDGDGRRAEKCTEGTTPGHCASGATGTLYWRNTAGETLDETDLSGNPEQEYIFFDGQRIARRTVNSSGTTVSLHYYFSDHLGSHAVVWNTNGTACEQDADYYPYGGVENDFCLTPVAQNYKFNGKERDSESGLDYFGARHYASTMGRFMTPDPAGAAFSVLSAPQSWNMYSYVQNNPLSFTDPDGRECVWDDGSFDSKDDAKTGSIAGCTGEGGHYFEPSTFTAGNGQDWSATPNADIAQLIASAPPIIDSPANSGNTSTSGTSTTINLFGSNWEITQFRQGTHPWRDNNPGDIVSGPFTSRNGQLGTDGRFAVFPTSGTGREAMDTLLHGGGYINLSINDAVDRYAPAFENNTASYQQFLTNALGVSGNTPLSSLSPAQFQTLENAITRVEGFNANGNYAVTTTTAIQPVLP